MPIYEYQCQKCKDVLEISQKISDAPKTKCPECGGKLQKLISGTAFQLKGSGWYQTDYKPSSGSNKAETKSESPKPTEKK